MTIDPHTLKYTTTRTSRERWVNRTRESVARLLDKERVAHNAAMIEGNLDIGDYMPSIGFVDQRSEQEIAAALRWLETNGLAQVVSEAYPGEHKDCGMPKPKSKAYALTDKGHEYAIVASGVFKTQRSDR